MENSTRTVTLYESIVHMPSGTSVHNDIPEVVLINLEHAGAA